MVYSSIVLHLRINKTFSIGISHEKKKLESIKNLAINLLVPEVTFIVEHDI